MQKPTESDIFTLCGTYRSAYDYLGIALLADKDHSILSSPNFPLTISEARAVLTLRKRELRDALEKCDIDDEERSVASEAVVFYLAKAANPDDLGKALPFVKPTGTESELKKLVDYVIEKAHEERMTVHDAAKNITESENAQPVIERIKEVIK